MDSAVPLIIIKFDEGEASGKDPVASPSGGKSASSSPDQSSDGLNGVQNALKRLISFGTVRHFATKVAQNNVSTVEMRTGAREYEQKLQFGMQTLNTAVDIGMAFVVNPALGALSLVMRTVDSIMNYTQRVRELKIAENREDISLGLARLRAGYLDPAANRGGRE